MEGKKIYSNNVITIFSFEKETQDEENIFVAVTGGAHIVYADTDLNNFLDFVKNHTAYLSKNEISLILNTLR